MCFGAENLTDIPPQLKTRRSPASQKIATPTALHIVSFSGAIPIPIGLHSHFYLVALCCFFVLLLHHMTADSIMSCPQFATIR